jgi:tetratricopeptide (TPR) repeat protein
VKFYKRFFFCARLLDDPVGAGLALNRLGIVYYKARRYGKGCNNLIEKSLQFHKKHKEFADKENLFAAYYNIGITNRFLKKYEDALESFNNALEWTTQRMDYESECVTLGQIGLTKLTMKNIEGATVNFKGCFDICQKMNNNRLQLDCLLCLGYLSYTLGNSKDTKMYFEYAHKVLVQ